MNGCPRADCGKSIESTMFACKRHWYQLPASLRSRIWSNYRSGDLGRIADGYEEAAQVWGGKAL